MPPWEWRNLSRQSKVLDDGLAYLKARRAAGAAEGTIKRECGVLLALLNHAVGRELLAKNPLALLPMPEGNKRERVAEPFELVRLLRTNSTDIGRMTLLGLLVPLGSFRSNVDKYVGSDEFHAMQNDIRMFGDDAFTRSRSPRTTGSQ